MKTAVSVPDDVFAQADGLAQERGISRSEMYTLALREYLEAHDPDNDPVTARLNELADSDPHRGAHPDDLEFGARAARHLIESGQWEW